METAITVVERNGEHMEDAVNPDKASQMRTHLLEDHPEHLRDIHKVFTMGKIKSCSSVLQRQVREAVEIARDKSHCLLNKKEEYN